MSRIQAVILDFDGVLAESNDEKTVAFEELAAHFPEHREKMMEYHLANYSSPRMSKFEYFVTELMGRPGDVEMVKELARQFSELVVKRVIACPDVPGTREFLLEFSARLPLYISSVTPQEELRAILSARGLASFLVAAYGNPPHPKGEAIGMVLEREGLRPEEVVFVGDSISDYRAATEGRLVFLGRFSGLPFEEIEVDLSPDLFGVADKLRNLI
jgi:phosphoglycolate phosphatase